jgi:hypothetical protein
MAVTGDDVISVFKVYCEEKGKFFLPDSPRQDDIADSLAKHYDSDDLLKAIKWYIDINDGPILVFNFALESRNLIEKIKKEQSSINKFKQVVAETRKLLEDEL